MLSTEQMRSYLTRSITILTYVRAQFNQIVRSGILKIFMSCSAVLRSCWEDIYIIWTQFRRFQDFLQVPNFINDPPLLLASLTKAH